MLNHTLLLIYRNLKRYSGTFIINLIGLSCGLACVLMIYLWVADELSFDKYHERVDRIYQVMSNTARENGIETKKDTPHSLSETLASDMPAVEYAATVTPPQFFPAFSLSIDDRQVKAIGKFAGTDFFRIFSYKLIEGNSQQVLTNQHAIVLSKSQAMNLFGSTSRIVGKTVTWEVAGIQRQCVVTGMFEDIPANSSEHFDFVLPFSDFLAIMDMEPSWNPEPFNTYLAVKEGVDVHSFEQKLNTYIANKSDNNSTAYFLKPYADNYLYSKYENGKVAGGRIEYVRIFSLIAFFVLVISSINFMNLTTAKASKRVKEIGIKKAMGVKRGIIIAQFLLEALAISILALFIAFVITFALLPQFNQITQKTLSFHFNTDFLLTILAITLATGFLSGSYPALYLSNFKPVTVLTGKISKGKGELFTRQGLVIFQFVLSIILIASVFVLHQQLNYIQNKHLGVNKDNVVHFESGAVSEAFLNEIRNLPGVLDASNMIGNFIVSDFSSKGSIAWNGKQIPTQSFGVNYGLIETLGIKVKEGRSFSRDFSRGNTQVILNEAAVNTMGLKEAVGTIISGGRNDIEIIGVVNNFHFQSLHEAIMPAQIRLDTTGATTFFVKIENDRQQEALQRLADLYEKFNPGLTFDYDFLDQDYKALYAGEQRISVLARYFAGLAIVISCLGLFGLAAFSAEARFREIAVRKVLGLSVPGVVWLLSKGFLTLLLIAICIGLPISYLLMSGWLQNFAFRIDLQWTYFVAAASLVVVVALFTVVMQSLKAAVVNPVKSLRSE
ncbi:ABC transporter permease [Parapedobacter lycopersici]|uniref:ABC transporter permease n=1 Tax=Parapedobacter lycopersici TaxID=1864939 RepID=UPI00214D1745|nr:ABC transporter permease [Parapedobacter lycopersici]